MPNTIYNSYNYFTKTMQPTPTLNNGQNRGLLGSLNNYMNNNTTSSTLSSNNIPGSTINSNLNSNFMNNTISKFGDKIGNKASWLDQAKAGFGDIKGDLIGLAPELIDSTLDSFGVKRADQNNMTGVEKAMGGLGKTALQAGLSTGFAPLAIAGGVITGLDFINRTGGSELDKVEKMSTGPYTFDYNDASGTKGTLWSRWTGKDSKKNRAIKKSNISNLNAYANVWNMSKNKTLLNNSLGDQHLKNQQELWGGLGTQSMLAKKGAKIPPAKFRSIIEKAQKGIKIKEPILGKENFEDYRKRIGKLNPSFLKDDPYYNLRGAFEGGLEPELNEEDGTYHLGSRNPKTGEILKRPGHPTWDLMLKGEEEAGYEVYQEGDKWFSREKKKYKDGGLLTKADKKVVEEKVNVNIIPDGAFHSRKNNLPDEIAEHVTHKGIPVIVKDGSKITQIAEIERSEIVFNKTVSEKIEDYLKDYNEAETQKEKDKIAIECGKLISDQIINNTIDNVGLLNKE